MEAARTATLDDLDDLEPLARAARDELALARGGPVYLQHENRRPKLRASLTESLGDPEQLVVVGTIDDTAVGYGIVRLHRLHSDELLAVVDDLFVDPEARRVGVGEAIMDALIEWSEGHGAVGIDSIALPGMRDTKNFFETFGLVARAIVVHRPLGAATTSPEEAS